MSNRQIPTGAKPEDLHDRLARAEPALTFRDVLAAVDAAADVPEGSKANLRRDVARVAELLGARSLDARVDVVAIRRRLEKITAAMLGFASEASLRSMRANLNRALRLAGASVMPGRSRGPLSPAWAALRERAEPLGLGLRCPDLHTCARSGAPSPTTSPPTTSRASPP